MGSTGSYNTLHFAHRFVNRFQSVVVGNHLEISGWLVCWVFASLACWLAGWLVGWVGSLVGWLLGLVRGGEGFN